MDCGQGTTQGYNFLRYPMFFLSLTTWDDLGHFVDTQEYLGLQPEPCTSVNITQAH